MLIMKFGGTSVGSPERIRSVFNLINDNQPKIVVLSAMSGTTNCLVEITNKLYENDDKGALELIKSLDEKYKQTVDELFSTSKYKEAAKGTLSENFNLLKSFKSESFSFVEEKIILAQGELMSTLLMQYYAEECGAKSALIPALEFMRIDRTEYPDNYYIQEQIKREISEYEGCNLFITQGYICRNAFGEVDNLKRGGSDYSASLIGAAVYAKEIQIWTDIDGFRNNDPRVVENTIPIRHLAFDEATELAYFGAKILHPLCVWPAKKSNIPIRLKDSLNPEAEGTLISAKAEGTGIKAIAAKDGITAIKVKSGRMVLAYGFLRKLFQVFEDHKTSIDMVTTSEVAVSLTIDDTTSLKKIEKELRSYGVVEVDNNMTIVCIVGHNIINNADTLHSIFSGMNSIPVRMVSYGGSRHNVSILLESKYKEEALKILNKSIFNL